MEVDPQSFGILLALGFAVGAYGTVIGAGGGFLLVPALLLLFPGYPAARVTAMSLTVVFFNAYAGTWAYARMGRIDYGTGIKFAVAGIPGALLGTWVVTTFERQPFDIAFALVLLAGGVYLAVQPVREQLLGPAPQRAEHESASVTRSLVGSIGSAYLGLMSTLLGIGGGILYVPFLIRVLRFPPHFATATSQFVLALVTLTAALVHFLRGELNGLLAPTAFLSLGVMMGAPVGATVSGLLRGPLLVRLLALALTAVAARLIWRFVA